MRYTFRVQSHYKYPSWIDEWNGVIVGTSPRFEWMVGWTAVRMLWWLNRKYVGPIRTCPIPIETIEQYRVTLWYARHLT